MSGSTPSIAPDPLASVLGPVGEPELHVAVGVVRSDRDRILIARRQPGVHLAGLWEFPGGKVEATETTLEALRRELREELGIDIGSASPLIQVRHRYPERRVLLDVWQVTSFAGVPRGLQGQTLRWVDPDDLQYIDFPAANRPIANAARLPDRYAILDSESGDPAVLAERMQRLAGRGIRMVQLRAKGLLASGGYRAFAVWAIDYCRAKGIRLLLNAEPQAAEQLGASGVHLNTASLLRLQHRPLNANRWVAASCHDVHELLHAQRIGVDFAVLSPVAPTPTHPGCPPLGWSVFADWIKGVNLPVYALGGLTDADLPQAIGAGAQGIAAIRGFL